MKPKMDRLEHDESLRAFRYHISGIFEAVENVAALLQRMNRTYKRDVDGYADASTQLEVEALFHLGYHVKQLRTPLQRLQRAAYKELEAVEEKNQTKSVKRKKTRRSSSTKKKGNGR